METQALFNKIHVEITNVCNLQCSFCPEVHRTKKKMAPDVFRKIIAEIKPFTQHIALHLMGDPLVHPELPQLIQDCAEQKLPVHIVTNGLLLNAEKQQALLNPIVQQVNFSLHSFLDNFPEKDPIPYLNKVFAFAAEAQSLRPDLYINFRIWNLESAHGGSEKNLSLLNKIAEEYSFSPPTTLNLKAKKSYKIKERLYINFDSEFTWPSLDLPQLHTKGFCYGLETHVGILVDGSVVPCCLDKEGQMVLGNILETSFKDIVRSERAEKIKLGFRQRQLVEPLCQRCNFIERFSS